MQITKASYQFALAKKLPWMLFCGGGIYWAHRKAGRGMDELTVKFTGDNQDIPIPTRALFNESIIEMRMGLVYDTTRLTKEMK